MTLERERDYYFEMARDEGRRADDAQTELGKSVSEARQYRELLLDGCTTFPDTKWAQRTWEVLRAWNEPT